MEGESETLEFKKSTAQLDKSLRAVCGFLNNKGGKVRFGIDKKGNIIGQDVSDQTLKSISQKIRQRIKPGVSPEIKVIEIEGKKIIEVKVKEGNNKPYYLDGVPYKRVGSESPVIPPDELEKIILEKKKRYFDSEICKEATLEDIDREKVKWFLRKSKYKRNFDVEPETPVKEVLTRLKLLKNGKLTNAAVLLFGEKPQKFFLHSKIRCARFKGFTSTDFIDMKIIEGNLFDLLDSAEKFILSHIKKAAKIVMLKREEVWEYPPDAIREAIVNAIIHRDYLINGNIRIGIFDDRIEITNPGKLPEPLTPKMLKEEHESILRNSLLANAFFLTKDIEQWGRGTNKIVGWCISRGLKEPDFEEIGGGFMVKFYSPEDVLSLIPEKGKIDLRELGLNKRQIEALRLMVNKGEIFTNKKYREKFNVSNKTAATDLNQLVKLGQIISKGKGRNVKYFYMINEKITQLITRITQKGE